MSTSVTQAADGVTFAALNGIPEIDFSRNLQVAVTEGRRMASILREIVALRIGPGKLTPNEYFYYQLWNPRLTREDQSRFVGKQAQGPMHIACNDAGWYATAADKVLFHTVMRGVGLPTPTLLAITHPTRAVFGVPSLTNTSAIADFLRHSKHYPLFAKPIDGKYSLSVISADSCERETDRVLLHGGDSVSVEGLAKQLAGREASYLLQRRLASNRAMQWRFGPPLWSVRVLVLMTPSGPVMHRAVAKIATGQNAADNFWRSGNMLGAIDLATGLLDRVIQGTGAEMTVNGVHPDTGRPIVGTPIPDWERLCELVREAARLFPAIRTQSWDIALTDIGPVVLEVNWGGDLNLPQLATGAGVLDDVYRAHLQTCGYRLGRS